MTDGQLLAGFARTRDEAAFAELVRRHGRMVHGACLRVTRSPELAEEAAQAAFLVLARKAGTVAREPDAGGWLYRVAADLARNALRDESRRRAYEQEAAAMRRVEASSGAGAVGAQHAAPLQEYLDAELARLPDDQRRVVVGLYLEGRPRSELARALGLPEGTVASRSAAALEKLRERLSRRGATLGAAALGSALVGMASAAELPASFVSLPSLAAAFAAKGAATAAGLASWSLAEGAIKAMFWAKMKVAAAVFAAVAAVGAGTPAVLSAMAGDGPAVAARDEAVRAKVVKVELVPAKMRDRIDTVTIDKGSKDGVRKGFAFEVQRDGKPVNRFEVESLTENTASGDVLWGPGQPENRKEVKVGDIATTKLTEVAPEKPAAPTAQPAAEAEAVNGLRLMLVLGKATGPCSAECRRNYQLANGFHKCALCEAMCNLLHMYCAACAKRLERCEVCGRPQPEGFQLRWENVGKEPLALSRDRCCDLYDRVFLKGPDGKLVPARQDNRGRNAHALPKTITVEPGKSDEEPSDPWFWVVKPEVAGEYTLWVEFEQKLPGNDDHRPDMGKSFWTGKVRSNEVKVTIEAKPGADTKLQPAPANQKLPGGWERLPGGGYVCPQHAHAEVNYAGYTPCKNCGAKVLGSYCTKCSDALGRCHHCGAQMPGFAGNAPKADPAPGPDVF